MSGAQLLNTETGTAARPAREREISEWIVNRLARELEIDPREIDVKVPFHRYGLDSLAAVHLVSSLEELTGAELSPTLPYEYPTIESLARHLSGADL